MRVFHDETGRVTSIYRGPPEWAPAPDFAFTDLPDEDVSELGGLQVIDGIITRVSLAALRADAIQRINTRVGEIRATFVTNIIGQDMIYLAKEQEARDYIADVAPVMANYPLMAAEIGPGLTAPTAYQLAQIWLAMGAQWRAVAAQLETLRLGAVYAVEAATSEAEIAGIEAAYQGALP